MTARRQQGFTLVELMVAIVISLLLLAGILQILLSNRASFGAQQELAGLQQESRLVSFYLENVIAHAGYLTNVRVTRRNLIYRATNDRGFTPPEGAVVDIKNNNGPGESDRLYVRFQSNGQALDCNGDPVGSPGNTQMASYRFEIDGAGQLVCNNVPLTEPDALWTFQVQFGLDTNDDNSIDRYVNDLSGNQHEQVRSLRVQTLLQSAPDVLPAGVDNAFQRYLVADWSSPRRDNDRRTYQLVDQTIALRNLLP